MCVFLISPVPIAEPLTSELIDTPVFYNLAPRPIKYRVSVPIPTARCAGCAHSSIARANVAPRCTSLQNAETISMLRDNKSTVPINHITGTACVSWEGFA